MNLKEKLVEILKNRKSEPGQGPFNQDLTLYGGLQLETIKEILLEDETFKDCEPLNFMSHPTIVIDDKPMVAQSIKWSEGLKLKGKCYILSLSLTPEMYNPDSIHTVVKDGAAITPTLYDPKTFKPKRKIVLEFSPERKQDFQINDDDIVRLELHALLDKVLDDPDTFRVKGERGLLIRGIFEEIESKDKITTRTDLSGVIDTEVKHYMAFYLEPTTKKGEVSMTLKHMLIPIELTDKFIEQYKDKVADLSLTKEEIEKFLEENK